MIDVAWLAADLLERSRATPRYVVAIAGPPGAGKSTLAEALLRHLDDVAPGRAALVPMDGFHFDNAVLDATGWRARKGAPETFDVGGLASALARIREGGAPVAVPVFDREQDLARAGARIVTPEHRIVLVEGNYLLLREPPWSDLAGFFDLTVIVSVAEDELRRRLVDRWRQHGHDDERALARAEGNDLPNAQRVVAHSRQADVTITTGEFTGA